MTLTLGRFSVALTTTSVWLEIGKFSIHMTRDTFHWSPDAWTGTTKSGADVSGNWLGLHFIGSRAV